MRSKFMSRKSEKSYEEKMQAVLAYLSGKSGCSQLAREHDVDENTVRAWLRLYETFGEEGLSNHSFNKSIPSRVEERSRAGLPFR
jgi:transposase